MSRDINGETLDFFREQLIAFIKQNYDTVEQFCWDKNLNKATISNLINNKKDFSVPTLLKIAKALDKELIIRMK